MKQIFTALYSGPVEGNSNPRYQVTEGNLFCNISLMSSKYLYNIKGRYDGLAKWLTFATSESHLSVGIKTRIASPTYDPSFALALPRLLVAIWTEGSYLITVTRVAGVAQYLGLILGYIHHRPVGVILEDKNIIIK